jgi:hypothetical protein
LLLYQFVSNTNTKIPSKDYTITKEYLDSNNKPLLSSRKPGSKKLAALNPVVTNLANKITDIKHSGNSVSNTTNINNTIYLLSESKNKNNNYINT